MPAYSEEQLRDFAMAMAWNTMDEETRQQMLSTARAALKAAEQMNIMWNMPFIGDKEDPNDSPGANNDR